MGKQRQSVIMEELSAGQGKRTVVVQEQEFRALSAREGLALTQVETPYLVEELKARGVEPDPPTLHAALEATYELAKTELPKGHIMTGVKDELMRVAYEKEGSYKKAALELGCGNSTVHLACQTPALYKRDE